MKKFLALALAIVMMAALAVPAFAANALDETLNTYGDENNWADTNDDGKEDGDAPDEITETTRIEYGVCQSYVVSIPAEIRLLECLETTAGKTVGYVYGEEYIGVSDVIIGGDEVLRIHLSSTNFNTSTNGTWNLIDTDNAGSRSNSAPVDYYVTVEDADVINSANYITDTADLSGYGKVVYQRSAEEQAAADYDEADIVLEQYRQTGNNGTAGSANNAWMYFSSKGTAQEGIYKDTLTFTVAIEVDDTITGTSTIA